MITIPRSLARTMRAVVKRTFSGPLKAKVFVKLTATKAEFVAQAFSREAAIEYRVAADSEQGTVTVPLEMLAACEGRCEEPVRFEVDNQNQVAAHWEDYGIPQQFSGQATKKFSGFPPRPAEMTDIGPGLFEALADASETTDPDSSRYALGCVNLRGRSGSIAATDGRQLLVQQGFIFPWQGDVLMPACRVFNSPELLQAGSVRIGRTDSWVAFAAGPWTIWLRINLDGRFPKIDDLVGRSEFARSRLSIATDDAAFLLATIDRLPVSNDSRAVTLDLNGEVLIRAQHDTTTPPTELALARSQLGGDQIRCVIDRRYLRRALALGLTELAFNKPDSIVHADDGNRHYLWMPIEPKCAIPPHAAARRISSLDSRPSRPPRARSAASRRRAEGVAA